jgi:hypothetical protein
MKFAPLISEIRFRPAPEADLVAGLLGWVSLELRGLRIDGVQVRRTRSGSIAMYWPERVTCDRRFPIVQPIDRATRIAIEREVIDELRSRGAVP